MIDIILVVLTVGGTMAGVCAWRLFKEREQLIREETLLSKNPFLIEKIIHAAQECCDPELRLELEERLRGRRLQRPGASGSTCICILERPSTVSATQCWF